MILTEFINDDIHFSYSAVKITENFRVSKIAIFLNIYCHSFRRIRLLSFFKNG